MHSKFHLLRWATYLFQLCINLLLPASSWEGAWRRSPARRGSRRPCGLPVGLAEGLGACPLARFRLQGSQRWRRRAWRLRRQPSWQRYRPFHQRRRLHFRRGTLHFRRRALHFRRRALHFRRQTLRLCRRKGAREGRMARRSSRQLRQLASRRLPRRRWLRAPCQRRSEAMRRPLHFHHRRRALHFGGTLCSTRGRRRLRRMLRARAAADATGARASSVATGRWGVATPCGSRQGGQSTSSGPMRVAGRAKLAESTHAGT